MKHSWTIAMLALGCLLSGLGIPAEEPPKTLTVPTVAVLPFEARERQAEVDDAGKSAAELLSIGLMESGAADMVERAELDKALTELQLSATGLTSRDSQVKLGKFIGAKLLVTGSIFKSGSRNFVVAKVIGTETSRVLGASVSGSDDFTVLVPQLSQKVAELIEKNTDKLLPKPENTYTVLAALSEKVTGDKRAVFVKVKEDIQVTVPDPAAETALKKLLLELGFTIAENRSDAAFAIVGEAVAAESGSYHKFTSATARLELSVYDRSGKLLATGAQRETVAGATYVIAAKESIQQAALRLAAEVLPVLGK